MSQQRNCAEQRPTDHPDECAATTNQAPATGPRKKSEIVTSAP
jgi:hypothetical protein